MSSPPEPAVAHLVASLLSSSSSSAFASASASASAASAPALAALKRAVRRGGPPAASTACSALFDALRGPCARRRLSSLRVCGELFERSAAFRAAVAPRMEDLLELAVGCRAERPLPPPREARAAP